MSEKQCLEVDNLFAQLCDSGGKSVVLCTKELDLGLEVGQPLLLALSTLESSDPGYC